MLLARDGHDVTVLERDPARPPGWAGDAWAGWERRGVNQFRQPHGFQPRFRQILEAELPEVAMALEAAGALRINLIRDVMPVTMTGGWREGDERFDMITGRRPFVEAVLATVAESTPRVNLRRGTAVTGLVTGPTCAGGRVPHVIGVRTESGDNLMADLIVDTSGRRSALPSWLNAIGTRQPTEEIEDSGFMYFGRHFRSADGSTPAWLGPALVHWGTISSLAVPADNGTWSLGIITAAQDKALFGLRQLDRWESVVRSLPLIAHWLDGTPLDDEVAVITKLEDRYRSLAVHGKPVVTGVVTAGDSWAASNPSVGRGASIGMIHAVVLRDVLRQVGLDRPTQFTNAFHQRTTEVVEPWYRTTLTGDRHRLAEVQAGIEGRSYQPEDSQYRLMQSLFAAAPLDPDCLRAGLDIRFVLRLPDQVFGCAPGLAEKLPQPETSNDRPTGFGPDRQQLLQLATAN
jgi:2-polyprenyl-6-methoxyphenol hydroxylase-like FAD-dependent oxidoreductase